MNLRRPSLLYLQCRERPEFSLPDLLAGGTGVVGCDEWLALAPHLGREIPLEFDDLAVFTAVTPGRAMARDALAATFGGARIDRLVDAGLLIGEHEAHAGLRERERMLGEVGWWGPAALAQTFGAWRNVDVDADPDRQGVDRWQALIDRNGPPPTEVQALVPASERLALPAVAPTPLDALLRARRTCRNFDDGKALSLADLAAVLHRVFGAQATQTLAPGAVALKKNSPSGGGLHPIEAYVLAQRVAGLPPGLYHYHCVAHALEPMRGNHAATLAAQARELVAGQAWFADAPVLVLMAARYRRNFWKYRRHAKAWRVVQLDAGHLSQNLYLAAAELGHGAFITAAIDDECAERLFELDGIANAPIAVCGFGPRAAETTAFEFDPLGLAPR